MCVTSAVSVTTRWSEQRRETVIKWEWVSLTRLETRRAPSKNRKARTSRRQASKKCATEVNERLMCEMARWGWGDLQVQMICVLFSKFITSFRRGISQKWHPYYMITVIFWASDTSGDVSERPLCSKLWWINNYSWVTVAFISSPLLCSPRLPTGSGLGGAGDASNEGPADAGRPLPHQRLRAARWGRRLLTNCSLVDFALRASRETFASS